jgi:hypothetical protein
LLPQEILRAITAGRNCRSARLLVAGTALLPQAPPHFFFLRLRPWTREQGGGA